MDKKSLINSLLANMTDAERLGTLAVGVTHMARAVQEAQCLSGMTFDGQLDVDAMYCITIGGGEHYAKIDADSAELQRGGIALPVELVTLLSDASFTADVSEDADVHDIVDALRDSMAAQGDARSVALEPLRAALRRESVGVFEEVAARLRTALALLGKELELMKKPAASDVVPPPRH